MLKNILVVAVIIAGVWLYMTKENIPASSIVSTPSVDSGVSPAAGVVLPVRWDDLGAQMVSAGVIDGEKFEQLYSRRGDLMEEVKKLLRGQDNGNLKITAENSGLILNLLWALGLGTKNEILEKGPMTDPSYGGAAPPAGGFASTGGWTLAKGETMSHYSQHRLIVLTPEQQQLVERVSKNIYRPCCDNSTYFPDCNHGMAMLGLLELAASQGVSEKEMYRVALQVNSYWFPDTYLTLAAYMKNQGIEWGKIDPKEILGSNYSSGSGYRQILTKMNSAKNGTGTNCGV